MLVAVVLVWSGVGLIRQDSGYGPQAESVKRPVKH